MPAVHRSLPVLALLALAAGCSHAPRPHQWSYEGPGGPSRWGDLSPEYAMCREGRNQSPVDIASSAPVRLTGARKRQALLLHLSGQKHAAREVNNGHTIQVNHAGADTLEIGAEHYALVQYHFHAPSEHTVNGRQFPMEAHFVHQASDGRLAVVGVLFAEGKANPALDPVWSNLPRQKGGEVALEEMRVALDALLPRVRTAFRYEGSLTTPPCSEGVKWIVLTTPVEVSGDQVAAFRSVVHDNNRPVQPLNGRSLLAERFERSR